MKRLFIFAAFASAILFSMVREWNAPTACAFPRVAPTIALTGSNPN